MNVTTAPIVVVYFHNAAGARVLFWKQMVANGKVSICPEVEVLQHLRHVELRVLKQHVTCHLEMEMVQQHGDWLEVLHAS